MKNKVMLLTISLISLAVILSLTGCSTVNPKNDQGISMSKAYNEAISGDDSGMDNTDSSLEKMRSQVQPLALKPVNYSTYTRNQENEINNLFPMLPNPSIVMYVYPHLAGESNQQTPVPGYSTVFSLYQKTYYQV